MTQIDLTGTSVVDHDLAVLREVSSAHVLTVCDFERKPVGLSSRHRAGLGVTLAGI